MPSLAINRILDFVLGTVRLLILGGLGIGHSMLDFELSNSTTFNHHHAFKKIDQIDAAVAHLKAQKKLNYAAAHHSNKKALKVLL